ncbi:hypothetical protein BGZ60DRAFT_531811 [Tricladium varicosporioides]|nr:hypothetical protein BGZ60DRAFT_531811 [Hymenoscyphus varicosporioides]
MADASKPAETTPPSPPPTPAGTAPKAPEPTPAVPSDTKVPEEAAKSATPTVPAAAPSVTAAITEEVVIEAGKKVVAELQKKTAEDLKTIGKGLGEEVKDLQEDERPVLVKVGEAIVDVVETIGEELVEGAEVVIEDVKAHPELIAEGAVAVGIGIASIVQPELIVGSVAMFGKMAADAAKKTASDIAIDASSHVVKELGKDLSEDIKDSKIEAIATSTTTDKTKTIADSTTGTIVEKASTSTSKETKIVITPAVKPSEPADMAPDASGDAKSVKPSDSSSAEKETSVVPAAEGKREEASCEPIKKDVQPAEEKKGTSIVVSGSGSKDVSVNIAEDGTITIGATSSSEKTKKPILAETTPETTTPAPAPVKEEETLVSAPTEEVPAIVEKSLKPEVAELKPVGESKPEVVPEVEIPAPVVATLSESENKGAEREAAKVEEPETADSPEPVSIPVVISQPPPSGEKSISDEILLQIHAKLDLLEQKQDALIKSPELEMSKEHAEPVVPADTHGESLLLIHSKLDALIASNLAAREVAAAKPSDTTSKVTPEHLEAIHAKLDKMHEALALKSQEGLDAVHTKLDTMHKGQEEFAARPQGNIEGIHTKLDAMQKALASMPEPNLSGLHSKLDQLQADASSKPVPNIDGLHSKLDKMQEALTSKPEPDIDGVHKKLDTIIEAPVYNAQEDVTILQKKLDHVQETLSKPAADPMDTLAPLHQKMDTIHEAILASGKAQEAAASKAAEAPIVPVATAESIDALHQRFNAMQATIDKLTETLLEKLAPPLAPPPLAQEEAVAARDAPAEGGIEGEPSTSTQAVERPSDTPVEVATVKATISATVTELSEASASTDTPPTEDSKPATKHVKRSSFFGGFFG